MDLDEPLLLIEHRLRARRARREDQRGTWRADPPHRLGALANPVRKTPFVSKPA